MLHRLVFIGPTGGGRVPDNGASLKNYHLLKRLGELGIDTLVIDTESWKKNPLILLKALCVILTHPRSKYIVSANNTSSYRFLKMMRLLGPKSRIIYWVIGGSIADWIKEGKVSSEVFKRLETIIVEGASMKVTLEGCGFDNVMVLPNFKNIDYIPAKEPRKEPYTRFVFLSRIVEQKGCGYIVKATEQLNRKYKDKFIVDFYGSIGDDYKNFETEIKDLSNVNYKGFLDLRNTKNYDILSSYDVMLFPTFWHGEGFPGILIDAFISGLPVIATKWHLNGDILEDNKTGILINPQDVDDLANAMEEVIQHPECLEQMSNNCRKEALKYSTESVVNSSLIKKIELY
jgi:glycosyltransferase involved in cell wall biosynthesis